MSAESFVIRAKHVRTSENVLWRPVWEEWSLNTCEYFEEGRQAMLSHGEKGEQIFLTWLRLLFSHKQPRPWKADRIELSNKLLVSFCFTNL